MKNRLAMWGVILTMVLCIALNGALLLLGQTAHDKLWDMGQLCLIGLLGLLKNSDDGREPQRSTDTRTIPIEAIESLKVDEAPLKK